MMKIGIEVKKHVELTNEEIHSLIAIKDQYWHHKYEEHLKWLNSNIMPGDYHVFVREKEGSLLAYLNIVKVDAMINQETYRMLGIGNVCVEHKQKDLGKGKILMAVANAFVKEMNSCGILLCREPLIPFYSKSSWEKLTPTEILIKGKLFKEYVMAYDPLHCLPVYIKSIHLERIF